MNEQYYTVAWLVYCAAAVGLVLATYWATRWSWRWFRELLCVVMAVILFTPTVVDPGKDFLAPAVAIAALDLLLKIGHNVWRAVVDLIQYGIIALLLYCFFALLRWLVERRLGRRPQPKSKGKAVKTRQRVRRDEDYEPLLAAKHESDDDDGKLIEPRL